MKTFKINHKNSVMDLTLERTFRSAYSLLHYLYNESKEYPTLIIEFDRFEFFEVRHNAKGYTYRIDCMSVSYKSFVQALQKKF